MPCRSPRLVFGLLRVAMLPAAMLLGAVLLGAMLLSAVPAAAQVVSDRPGFWNGAYTVAPGRVQAEAGYALDALSDAQEAVHELGQLVVRVGVTERLEARALVGSYVAGTDTTDGGYTGAALGAKLSLAERPTWSLSAEASATLPTATGGFDTGDDRARPEARLLFDGALGRSLTLSVNVGASAFATGAADAEVLAIPALTVALTPTTSAYVGYAGSYRDDAPDSHFAEAGATLLARPDVQLDLNTGYRLDDAASRLFVGVGVAYLF